VKCPGCAALIPVAADHGIPTQAALAAGAVAPPAVEERTLPPTGSNARPAQPAPDSLTLPPSPRPAASGGDASLPLAPESSVARTGPHVPAANLPVAEVVVGQPAEGQRYVMEGEIGRGGMGAVLRAVDSQIRREVAVKFLLENADDRLKARFVEEAQITGQLEHPNIVPIHDLGIDGQGHPYFAMKMVKGHSLAQALDDLRRGDASTVREYTLSRLLGILVNICHALAYAHARGVIHRDLKPANIMLGDFGEVYVMDWGLAKVLGRDEPAARESSQGAQKAASQVQTGRKSDSNLTQDGSVLGTPAYMPPEQAMGQIADLDQRSDVYSLGAILYEMLTLEPPVGRSDDLLATLMRVVEGKVIPLEKAAPQRARQGLIPPELSAVALKALAQFPENRYQKVEALQRDIQLFLEGRSVSAKRDSAWELFKKLVKRNKGVSAATAAAAVVLAAVVGIFLKVNYDARLTAESAQRLAEENYDAYRKADEEKHASNKKSAPAFLDAARLLTANKQFASALTQVDTALGYDAEQTEAYLLKGQLLLGLERYAEAAAPLDEYLRRKPDDRMASKLAALAKKPEPDKAAYFLSLNALFQEQKAFALAGHMTHLADRFIPDADKLALYRKRIDAAWPGIGERLRVNERGELVLNLGGLQQVQDISRLKGLPLSVLSLNETKVQDLGPLRDMPLSTLNITNCPVRDLSALKGIKLKTLQMWGLGVSDLEPLRGMPLESLSMRGCGNITSLEPLRDCPTLTNLIMPDCLGVTDIGPLQGMKLKQLVMWNNGGIKDISPLRGQPLEELSLKGLGRVRDFEHLQGMPLKVLDLAACDIQDLGVLKGMPLTSLSMPGRRIQDLAPLKGMKLTWLNLVGCVQLREFGVLKGMPLEHLGLDGSALLRDLEMLRGAKTLQSLFISGCPEVRDLRPLEGVKTLEELAILECPGIRDLAPLDGLQLKCIHLTPRLIPAEGMEVLRRMKRLEMFHVGERRFPAAEFWPLYDKGEFKK
jgi:serine/threonine protein kinase